MAHQTYGLIGHPVKHSLSPAMHNAAFKELHIDAGYRLYDIEPGMVEAFLKDAPAQGISGLNITIPHKVAVKEYLERSGFLDDNVRKIGAVNTVLVAKDGLYGFNTDGPGFYRSLVGDLRFEPEHKRICVLGAGGAARAVVMYLGNAPAEISVADVDRAKVDDLKKQFGVYYNSRTFKAVYTDDLEDCVRRADLFVNTTPVGMKASDPSPIKKEWIHDRLYIYDLVYNVPETALVKEARQMRRHAVTGTGMLLAQGAIAFEIWTGVKAPVAVMREALKAALGAREKT